MSQFLVISPHTEEDCTKVVKLTLAIGFLTHFYWGCKVDDHTAYAILEAENEKEALLSVPTVIRNKSKAIKVVQFDPKEVKGW
ncbi:MAG: hypothetical protein Q8L88_01555 [Bacteroidota bacterium]|nr:hypothetical protein [Bacteroidota bacterium]